MTVASRRPSSETVTAALLVVLGLGYGLQAVREGIGSAADSGPGLFPLVVAAALVASALVVVVQEHRSEAGAAASLDDDGGALEVGEVHWHRIAAVLLTSLAVPFAASTVGFVTSLSVAMAVIAKVMGMRGWWRPAALGVGFGVATWWVFVYWLFVPLPAGVLGLG